jgi:hypothetical protein
MIQFDLYVGKILYKSTNCVDDAFRTFKKWRRNGADVQVRFITVREVKAA